MRIDVSELELKVIRLALEDRQQKMAAAGLWAAFEAAQQLRTKLA